jgi:hypothetical protein|tara:strand:+ start:967 stop:1227 length:261 start_codon:yes stop_codon:yes gene_type:complete
LKELLKSLGIHENNYGACVGVGNWLTTTNAGVLNSNVIGQIKGSAVQFVDGDLPFSAWILVVMIILSGYNAMKDRDKNLPVSKDVA